MAVQGKKAFEMAALTYVANNVCLQVLHDFSMGDVSEDGGTPVAVEISGLLDRAAAACISMEKLFVLPMDKSDRNAMQRLVKNKMACRAWVKAMFAICRGVDVMDMYKDDRSGQSILNKQEAYVAKDMYAKMEKIFPCRTVDFLWGADVRLIKVIGEIKDKNYSGMPMLHDLCGALINIRHRCAELDKGRYAPPCNHAVSDLMAKEVFDVC